MRKELEEQKKEITFLKKSSHILRKANRFDQYQFIDGHKQEFGVHWLLRRMGICPMPIIITKRTEKKATKYKKSRSKTKS